MDSYRVRNLVTGRVYLVRGDHYAVSHQDFEIVHDEPVEPAAPAAKNLADMSISELRAFAEEVGVTLNGVRSKAAIIALLDERT